MLAIPDVSWTHGEDLLRCVAETSQKAGHRLNRISLVCIANTKVLFSFSESLFGHSCGSEVAAPMGSENTRK